MVLESILQCARCFFVTVKPRADDSVLFVLKERRKDRAFTFNLDGGGSTQSTIGKKQINRVIDIRKVPNVIIFE